MILPELVLTKNVPMIDATIEIPPSTIGKSTAFSATAWYASGPTKSSIVAAAPGSAGSMPAISPPSSIVAISVTA